jgi:hypothetical protein
LISASLEALADDTATTVTEAQQEALSRWLFKTAIVHELLQPQAGPTTSAMQRAAFRAGVAPEGWLALIARTDAGNSIRQHLSSVVNWTHDDGTHRGRARLVTTRYGHLAAQVLLHSLDELPVFAGLLGGPGFAAVVWPIRGPVTWPPGRTLTPEWFDKVSDLGEPAGREAAPG